MLNFFKSNNISIVIANVVLIFLFRVLFFFSAGDLSLLFHHAEPATRFLVRIFHITSSTALIWLVIGGAVLCFFESLLVNAIINNHKVTSKKTYLGGILFVVFTSFVPECMVLSPAMISVLFLLLTFDRLFEMTRPEKLYSYVFDLGFLSGIAILFYFPSVYVLILAFIGFATMRPVAIKEIMMIITGFVAVAFSVFVIYFWFDALPQLLPDLVNMQNRRFISFGIFTHWQWIIVIWLALLALWLLVNVPGLIFSSVIQTRKYVSILTIGSVLAVFFAPLSFNLNLSHLVFLFAAMSILYTVYFVETKTNFITEILFISLILSVFVFQYLPLFIKI